MAKIDNIPKDPMGAAGAVAGIAGVSTVLKQTARTQFGAAKIFGMGAAKFAGGVGVLNAFGLTMEDVVSKIKSSIPITSGAYLYGKFHEGIQDFDNLRANFSKQLSIIDGSKDDLAKAVYSIYTSYARYGTSLDDVVSVTEQLVDILHNTNPSEQLMNAAIKASTTWGITAESAGKLTGFANKFFGSGGKKITEMFNEVGFEARSLGLSSRSVLESLSEYPNYMLRFNINTKQGRVELGKSLAVLNKMGASLSEAVKLSDDMLNIQNAAEKSAAFSAMGMNLSPMELVRMAIEGPEKLQVGIMKQMQNLGIDMSNGADGRERMLIGSIASIMGSDFETLSGQFSNFEKMQRMSVGEQKSAAARDVYMQKLQEQRSSFSTQWANLTNSFFAFVMNELAPPLTSALTWINERLIPAIVAATAPLRSINDTMKKVLPKSLDTIIKLLIGVIAAIGFVKLSNKVFDAAVGRFGARFMAGAAGATVKAAGRSAARHTAAPVVGAAARNIGASRLTAIMARNAAAAAPSAAPIVATGIRSTISNAGSRAIAGAGLKLGGIAAKMGGKALPFGIGAIIGGAFALQSLREGDTTGALLEMGSGLASIIPVVGTAASIGLAAINVGRSVSKSMDQSSSSIADSSRSMARSVDRSLLSKDEQESPMAVGMQIVRQALLDQAKRDIESRKADKDKDIVTPIYIKMNGRKLAEGLMHTR